MNADDEWLIIGELVAAQGLQGELRVKPSSEFPERFTEPGKRWLKQCNNQPKPVKLLKGRKLPGKSIYVIQLEGVQNRTTAETLLGASLLVPSSSRPALNEGEFHLLDLIGLEARLEKESPAIGEVKDLITAGNDLLEIELKEGKKTLVPFVKTIVPEVHLDEGWLLLTPPPGLLDL